MFDEPRTNGDSHTHQALSGLLQAVELLQEADHPLLPADNLPVPQGNDEILQENDDDALFNPLLPIDVNIANQPPNAILDVASNNPLIDDDYDAIEGQDKENSNSTLSDSVSNLSDSTSSDSLTESKQQGLAGLDDPVNRMKLQSLPSKKLLEGDKPDECLSDRMEAVEADINIENFKENQDKTERKMELLAETSAAQLSFSEGFFKSDEPTKPFSYTSDTENSDTLTEVNQSEKNVSEIDLSNKRKASDESEASGSRSDFSRASNKCKKVKILNTSKELVTKGEVDQTVEQKGSVDGVMLDEHSETLDREK